MTDYDDHVQRTSGFELFMTPVDEDVFASKLQEADSDIAFIDDQRWANPEPPLVPTISAANLRLVYIWNRAIAPQLRGLERPDGMYQGPAAGPVIQFERSTMKDGELRSGSVSAGYDTADEPLARFVRLAMDVLRHATFADVVTLTGDRHPYRIGADAKRWATASEANRLRDRSVQLYFRIADFPASDPARHDP